jgi:hypothetical protein
MNDRSALSGWQPKFVEWVADRRFKRPLLRLRRFSVSHSSDVGSGLAPVGNRAAKAGRDRCAQLLAHKARVIVRSISPYFDTSAFACSFAKLSEYPISLNVVSGSPKTCSQQLPVPGPLPLAPSI